MVLRVMQNVNNTDEKVTYTDIYQYNMAISIQHVTYTLTTLRRGVIINT